jgi:DNA repair exonuclease SbcCD ATPase subunit
MKLREAHIDGFGRLTDRSLRFCPGVQVVLGPNEAGKSTLQQFLLAMLFGVKREDRKRREYLPQYERYRPWSGERYGGRLVYQLASGELFEIQRVFERDSESVQILDAVSGRDRSREYTMDSRKERTFMADQLQVSRQLFEATTSLGQLSARPNAEGVEALRERVQGLLDSGDEAFSTRVALDSLGALRERFGTERTPTRGVGQLQRQIELLHGELDLARARHEEILELCARRNDTIRAYTHAEHAWRRRRAEERAEDRATLERRLRQAEAAEQRLQALHHEIDTYADIAGFDPADEARAREAAAAAHGLERAAADLARRVGRLEERDAALAQVVDSLTPALGGLQRESLAQLDRLVSRLREDVGRFRQARARHLVEQAENRTVVEQLRRHHGRDWADDGFLSRLSTELAAARDTRVDGLDAEAREAARAYAQRKHVLVAAAITLPLGLAAVAAAMLLTPQAPAAARIATPLLLFLILITFLPAVLRQFLAARDRAAALRSQLQRVRDHQREARVWLQDVIERNELQRLDDVYALRREYESLRAQAERPAQDSSSRELQEREQAVRDSAERIRALVSACAFDRLEALMAEPPPATAELLPYVEARHDTPEADDTEEVARLLADLSRLPLLRRAFVWRDRAGVERERDAPELHEFRAHVAARQAELQEAQRVLADILARAGAATLEDLAARVARARRRDALVRERATVEGELAGVLGGESLDVLRRRAMAAEAGQAAADAGVAADDRQPRLLEEGAAAREPAAAPDARALEELGRDVERLSAERAQLEERLMAREREGRTLAEIELAIQESGAHLEDERRRDEALVLAAATLSDLSIELHRQVAPRMNARVAEIFAHLSRTQHRDIRLDEDLTPRVRVDGGALLGADSLSGGAADQLYFALRVTAGEQLSRGGERLPLLLDDPFVQYDAARLEAALALVVELAGEHQVFLFTCEQHQADELIRRAAAQNRDHAVLQL